MADASVFVVIVRLVVAVAVVIGLLLLTVRFGRRMNGRGSSGPRTTLRVVSRQALGRSASVAVVRVDDRLLLLGVTDGSVNLLTELDAEAEQEPVTQRAARATRPTLAAPRPSEAPGPHAGSPSKEAPGTASPGSLPRPPRTNFVDALRERTVRRA